MLHTYNARTTLNAPKGASKVRHGRWMRIILILLGVFVLYAAYALLRPMDNLRTTIIPPITLAQVKVAVPWPGQIQAAFGSDGSGTLATHQQQTPRPVGSIATVIAAMAVLEKKPLKSGGQGPDITLSQRDVDLYDQYVANENAALPVAAGSSVSQYQALQAMLLPAANNVADTTVLWAFGSLQAYTDYANAMVKRLGMSQTTIVDATGLSPKTISTAADLVRLGDAALDNPVLREITGQSSAVFPGVGTIETTNTLLGQDGIRGFRSTQTPEAGGNYLATADIMVAGSPTTVIAAIMGAPDRDQAMKAAIPLFRSAPSAYNTVQVVRSGQSVGTATSPWGSSSPINATEDITVLAWSGKGLAPKVTDTPVPSPALAGTRAGSLSLESGGKQFSSKLVLEKTVDPPSAWWRLTHPL